VIVRKERPDRRAAEVTEIDGHRLAYFATRARSAARLVASARAARAARDVVVMTLAWVIERIALCLAAVKESCRW